MNKIQSALPTLSREVASPTEAKDDFFIWLERVAEEGQVVIVDRGEGRENVAMIPESELTSLLETVYLLREPANASRLFAALAESKAGKIRPQTIEELRQEIETLPEEEKLDREIGIEQE
ncbi:MAG: prevent-host-death protein [Oscillatoria sp. SIO1A7]|nr:prevent-host-death protein [Oscillatoria sp. SIO1A7]